jgi:chromosome segregation ATPase
MGLRSFYRNLAEHIGKKVRASIQPQVREISDLARKMAQEQMAAQPNAELVDELQREIRRRETEIDRISEQEIKGLEEKIQALEEAVQPSKEQIRKLEAKIREIEKDVRAGERELGRQGDRSVPPPPPPPAP